MSKTCPDWEEDFNTEAYSLKADQLVRLPSALLEAFVRSNGARCLDLQQPVIEEWLKNRRHPAPIHMSALLTKDVRELLLTKDPCLQTMGAYVERYVMEHLLFNLSRFVPEGMNHAPLPIYILQQWIKGEPLNMVRCALFATPQEADQEQAIRALLAPFGLEQQETFPLPPFLKQWVWPAIEHFQKKGLPDLILKAIPAWTALTRSDRNQQILNDVFEDDSLTKSIHNLTKTLIHQAGKTIDNTHALIGKKLHSLVPSLVLSDNQQQAIEEQFNTLLEDNAFLAILREGAEEGLEALAMQLCVNLLNHFTQAAADQPFALWLFSEQIKAYGSLVIEKSTNQELQALIDAIHLKQALHHATNPVDAASLQARFDPLWSLIEPKFHHLAQHLLHLLGYPSKEHLPLPERFHSQLWKTLFAHLPLVLFEQSMDWLLPVLEKQALQGQVNGLPQGTLIQEGCRLLAQDIVDHLPEWVDSKGESLLEKWVSGSSDIQLTEKAQQFLSDTLIGIVLAEGPVYDVFWQGVESYLEALFLKIALHISQISSHDLASIQTLAQHTREALLALEVDVLEAEAMTLQQTVILSEFVDELLAQLGMASDQPLFGIPQQGQERLLKEIKKCLAQALLGMYQIDHRIRQPVVISPLLEETIPVSEVARAVFALTRYALDKSTEALTRRVDGEVQVVAQLSDPLTVWLGKQQEQGYEVAELFQRIIAEQRLTPWLVSGLDLLHGSDADLYKTELTEWINPLLTNQVIQYMTPLLQKEQEGGAAFDQAFVMTLLPLLIDHLKHLNQASGMSGGLTRDHVIEAAGIDLHPAISVNGSEEERTVQQKLFYDKQAHFIFQLIFPHGQEDLAKILPEVELSDDQFDHLSTSVQELMASQLPKACKALFNKEMLTEIFSDLFKHVIHSLDQPIRSPSLEATPLPLEENDERQEEMNQLVGELVVEAARFMELPIDFFHRFSGWTNRIIGLNAIEKGMYQSIGKAILKQFNGELLANTFQQALPKLAEKDANKVKEGGVASPSEGDLRKLERELAQKSFAFIFRTLAARIERATDVFSNSLLKSLHRAVFAVAYAVATWMGKLFRFLRMEQFVIRRLDQMIRYRREKAIDLLSRQELHENVVYRSVEAIEDLFISGSDGYAD